MNSYYVYILLCSDGSLYTGITNDLKSRLNQHKAGCNSRSFTFDKRPCKLKFAMEFQDVLQAIYFEKKIKRWTRAKKMALIRGDFDRLKMLAECKNDTHHKYRPE